MTELRSLPGFSLIDRIANRRTERTLVQHVDRAFEADPEVLDRVRSAILAQVPGATAVQPGPVARPRRANQSWHVSPALVVVALALAGGLAVVALRPGSSGPVAGVAVPSASSNAGETADLDQSDGSVQLVIAAARAGDATALRAVLLSYQASLASIRADLRLPGVDAGTVGSRLRAQATALASVAGSVTAANAALFGQVTTELNAIVASLPVIATPSPSGPAKAHPTPSPAPAGSHQPGSSNAGGNGNGNAGGNGNGNAGGNGNGNAGGNGNGNAGGNGNGNAGGNGNGKGHNKGASPSP